MNFCNADVACKTTFIRVASLGDFACLPASIPVLPLDHHLVQNALAICLHVSYMLYVQHLVATCRPCTMSNSCWWSRAPLLNTGRQPQQALPLSLSCLRPHFYWWVLLSWHSTLPACSVTSSDQDAHVAYVFMCAFIHFCTWSACFRCNARH